MHIAFVTTGDVATLATLKRATGMAPYLQAHGHSVTILLQDSTANRNRVRLECPDVDAFWFPVLAAQAERTWKTGVLREIGPDLVYICGYGLRNAIAKRGLSAGTLIEHCELGSKTVTNSFPRRIFELAFEYASIRRADALVCASRHLEDRYRKRLRKTPFRPPLCYLPYAFGTIDQPTAEHAEKARILRASRNHRPAILYMGTLRRNYGLFTMLEAIACLQAETSPPVLELVGTGPDLARARQWVQDRALDDCVTFRGYVADDALPAYLLAADAFVAPMNDSPQDLARCPSKIFIYLSYRKPIITCRLGEPAACLGDGAWYYHPGNPDELAAACAEATAATGGSGGKILPDPSRHSWEFRTGEFLQFLQSIHGSQA